MRSQVCVYGSLKKGQVNHDGHLSKAEFVGERRLPGYVLLRLCASYPVTVSVELCPDLSNRESEGIVVETYSVTESTLASLDRLEGHPNSNIFRRFPVELPLNGEPAWFYACTAAGFEEIRHSFRDWQSRIIKNGRW